METLKSKRVEVGESNGLATQSGVSRRAILGGILAGGFEFACGSATQDQAMSADATTAANDAADSAASSAASSATSAEPTTAGGVWATGGTAAMLAAASYPDPFTDDDTECVLTCTLTQGPCWAPSAPIRQDVSEGEKGVPLRLMLRVLDDACSSIEGAEVEIWYCNVEGVYSAEDVENPGFCTGNDEHALESYFFRGRGLADASGRVTFDGCFPGWYASRAVHIHFLVRMPDEAGASDTAATSVISQVFFPEGLTREIFDRVTGYQERGQPDTSLATDTVLSGVDDATPYLVDYAQMEDGAMLAWKTIRVSTTSSCGATGGAGGGGMMGGQPPREPPQAT